MGELERLAQPGHPLADEAEQENAGHHQRGHHRLRGGRAGLAARVPVGRGLLADTDAPLAGTYLGRAGDAGITEDSIYLSMERNMKCGVGLCGHCQFGPLFICREGPVQRYDLVEPWLKVQEL